MSHADIAERPVTAKCVTIKKYAELSGISPGAIRKRCERGQFLEGREWHKDPLGRVMIDVEAVEKWVMQTA